MPEPVTLREYIELQLAEICKKLDRLQVDVDSLKLTRAELAGKASQSSVVIAYVIAILSLAVSALKLLGG